MTDTPKLLRLHEVLDLIPCSKSHWLNGVKVGIHPKPVRVGARMVAWRVDDIASFIESCKEVE